jgi:hypothetical protein
VTVVIAQDTNNTKRWKLKENPMKKPLSNKQRRETLKTVPKRKRGEVMFTEEMYKALPKGGAK